MLESVVQKGASGKMPLIKNIQHLSGVRILLGANMTFPVFLLLIDGPFIYLFTPPPGCKLWRSKCSAKINAPILHKLNENLEDFMRYKIPQSHSSHKNYKESRMGHKNQSAFAKRSLIKVRGKYILYSHSLKLRDNH